MRLRSTYVPLRTQQHFTKTFLSLPCWALAITLLFYSYKTIIIRDKTHTLYKATITVKNAIFTLHMQLLSWPLGVQHNHLNVILHCSCLYVQTVHEHVLGTRTFVMVFVRFRCWSGCPLVGRVVVRSVLGRDAEAPRFICSYWWDCEAKSTA